jgi:putative FmdB family regulatory protein
MPTYEYGCLVCKNEFEVQQSIKDEKGAECPKCRTFCGNRLVSKSSFMLKGSGWAADNYSSKTTN